MASFGSCTPAAWSSACFDSASQPGVSSVLVSARLGARSSRCAVSSSGAALSWGRSSSENCVSLFRLRSEERRKRRSSTRRLVVAMAGAATEGGLLVIGPGVLGRIVAQQWLKANEGCTVVGQTNTTDHHEELRSLGIVPVVKDGHNGEKFSNVIFCAPPSGSVDYAAELRAAAHRWNGEGTLLFTSSSAMYDVSDNEICDETAPAVQKGANPRTDKLLAAEDEVLKVGGNVVRLAGLYTFERGAHYFYLMKGTVDARPEYILNVIHYEDAASLCLAILKGGHRGRIFAGCDSHPLSRQEMMDAVNSSGKFAKKFIGFTSSEGQLGKRMNNNLTRAATGWKPKYESFPSFISA